MSVKVVKNKQNKTMTKEQLIQQGIKPAEADNIIKIYGEDCKWVDVPAYIRNRIQKTQQRDLQNECEESIKRVINLERLGFFSAFTIDNPFEN